MRFVQALCATLVLGSVEVTPRTLDWDALSPRRFDLRWQLPDAPRDGARDLVGEMERLTRLRFDLDDPDGGSLRTLGDLVRAAREYEPRARRVWLTRLAGRAPELFDDWGAGFDQLLFDEGLHGARWDPEDDLDDDGLLTAARGRDLSAAGAPWDGLEVRPLLEQAATLMFADLASIKAAEGDYRRYLDDVAATYEAVYPLRESFFRGTDPAGNDFATLAVYVRSDLPFPYSSYECEVRQLHRVDAAGRPVTDIYSTSDDFHWLAGKDVFLPVETSEGRLVAWLVVRLYGFDIDGVPDKPRHRRTALRSSLGNLKRRAEALTATGPGTSWTGSAADVLGSFRVFGVR